MAENHELDKKVSFHHLKCSDFSLLRSIANQRPDPREVFPASNSCFNRSHSIFMRLMCNIGVEEQSPGLTRGLKITDPS